MYLFDSHLELGLFAIGLKCSKSASKHRGTCSILDVGTVWRSWQRSYCEKLVLKT